ncbi:MAG TPA: aminotransferase class V-fold PLP-dependent enzyme [Thermoanaerobaculia bacterium]|jgi:selenocysteine lyase/cysteine desulfurase
MLTRRSLLVNGSLAVAATAVAAPPQSNDSHSWDAVRRQFDVNPGFVHLGLFYLVSHPRPVREAIDAYRRRIDANPLLTIEHSLFEKREDNLNLRVEKALAGYIGASETDIALTQNTTTGLALIYHGLPLQAGDEVLTTTHDHMVHHEAIRFASERAGATVRKIALFDSHDAIGADEIVARIRKAIAPKTRVVGVTWVHSSTGLKLPIRRIADAIAEVNANRDAGNRVLLVVDGVHGLGVEPPNIAALGADAFSAGTHKWLFAPRGTGFVWARPEVWASMRPIIPTFSAGELFMAWAAETKPQGPARAAWFTPGGFQAYEHWWGVPAAIDFHRSIGSARITERIHSLNEQAKNELAKMPHVTLYTPRSRDLSAGIVTFDVKGMTAPQVVQRLLERDKILASTTPYRVSYARIAFGIQNDEAEVEKTLRAIRALS